MLFQKSPHQKAIKQFQNLTRSLQVSFIFGIVCLLGCLLPWYKEIYVEGNVAKPLKSIFFFSPPTKLAGIIIFLLVLASLALTLNMIINRREFFKNVGQEIMQALVGGEILILTIVLFSVYGSAYGPACGITDISYTTTLSSSFGIGIYLVFLGALGILASAYLMQQEKKGTL